MSGECQRVNLAAEQVVPSIWDLLERALQPCKEPQSGVSADGARLIKRWPGGNPGEVAGLGLGGRLP